MAISMLKIRRPLGRLIFNMGIAIPGKTVFLIETAPWLCALPWHQQPEYLDIVPKGPYFSVNEEESQIPAASQCWEYIWKNIFPQNNSAHGELNKVATYWNMATFCTDLCYKIPREFQTFNEIFDILCVFGHNFWSHATLKKHWYGAS